MLISITSELPIRFPGKKLLIQVCKLLELTGQTPVEFIRSVKLDKAAVLLRKSDMNVAQIAYSVGFSSPNYFAKSFKTKFNMLPSEYMNKIRKEGERKDE